jgi:tripartite-type tricarboxylate transporter receptor subunit TctC
VGVLARAGTPADIVKKLSDEIAQAVKAPEVIEKFTTAGIDAVGSTPDAYAKVIEQENAAMAKAGKAADLKAD